MSVRKCLLNGLRSRHITQNGVAGRGPRQHCPPVSILVGAQVSGGLGLECYTVSTRMKNIYSNIYVKMFVYIKMQVQCCNMEIATIIL